MEQKMISAKDFGCGSSWEHRECQFTASMFTSVDELEQTVAVNFCTCILLTERNVGFGVKFDTTEMELLWFK